MATCGRRRAARAMRRGKAGEDGSSEVGARQWAARRGRVAGPGCRAASRRGAWLGEVVRGSAADS